MPCEMEIESFLRLWSMQYSMGTDLPLEVSGHAERMINCLPTRLFFSNRS